MKNLQKESKFLLKYTIWYIIFISLRHRIRRKNSSLRTNGKVIADFKRKKLNKISTSIIDNVCLNRF